MFSLELDYGAQGAVYVQGSWPSTPEHLEGRGLGQLSEASLPASLPPSIPICTGRFCVST